MKRILFTCFAVVAGVLATSAQDQAYKILHQVDTTLTVKLSGINLGSRDFRHFVIEFPSKDADGKAVNVSGVVTVPSNIVNGSVPCDGIILFHHSTIGSPEDAPSQGGLESVSALLANPLRPNFIVVACDNIGYGSSLDHKLAYLCGDVNARNAIDGLLAARKMLTDQQIPQGKYLFNIGYSQGGTDAMYAAKVRDMEYKDKGVTFTKTYVGGGVMDCEKAYKEFVKDGAWDSLKDVAIMLISLNENYHLGLNYSEFFKEPVASSVPEFLKTKKKSALNLENVDSLKQLMQPAYLDENSDAFKKVLAKLGELKIANGWEPDVTQNYYVEHSRHDNYVPVQNTRELLKYMTDKGFKKSLVPGKSNLQTNMLVFKLNHQQSAIVWAIQTMGAIQFWPVLYYEGEQNRYYHDVVKDLNLMKFVKYLEKLGLDLRKIVSQSPALAMDMHADIADGSIDPNGSVAQMASSRRVNIIEILQKITNVLNSLNLTMSDVMEMLDDSGITIADLMEVVAYLQSSSSPAMSEAPFMTLTERTEPSVYLMRLYENKLADWYKQGGIDVDYDSWGWSSTEE